MSGTGAVHGVDAEWQRASPTTEVLGESPAWCAVTRRLWWVDVRGPTVLRLDPRTGATEQWTLPEVVGGLVLDSRGEPWVALASGVHRFDPDTGTLTRYATPEPADLGNRLNDTKCDRQGRLWTGSMRDFGLAISGSLYRIESGRVARMLGDIAIPNGPCWSPDGRVFYFADTPRGRIHAYDFDIATGDLGPPRVFVERGVIAGGPDGATVDAEGCVWSARYGGGGLARIDPDGRVERFVRLPVSQVSSCMFGGDHLDVLYVTTSRQKLAPEALAREPLAGALLAVDAGVRGIAETPFAG